MFEVFSNTYRITVVMKVETNINTEIKILSLCCLKITDILFQLYLKDIHSIRFTRKAIFTYGICSIHLSSENFKSCNLKTRGSHGPVLFK
jgi:hypothetical protein